MNIGKTIFAQLMEFISQYEFRKYVERYNGHYKVLNFTCWEQFLCMSFAQLTYRESLRDIELSTTLFPWAAYSRKRGAVLMHTLLNLRGNIPSVIVITNKFISELKILDQLTIEPGAIYIVDRGYIDFKRFYVIHESKAFFVTRAKIDSGFKRIYSQKVDKTTGIQCDQVVSLIWFKTKKKFPEKLRRIKYIDSKTKKRLVFLTNNFTLPAKTIADLYKSRWQIELFFKWIKQHLRIKAFFGRSENAVKTQIWIAVSTYVLVAILKKELNIKLSLYTILQILSVSIFEKVPILQALSDSDYQRTSPDAQMSLF